MSIAELNIVDAIGVDKKENALRMMISDHLDWEDKNIHLEILQEKSMHIFSILAISNMKVNMEMILKKLSLRFISKNFLLLSVKHFWKKYQDNLINIT